METYSAFFDVVSANRPNMSPFTSQDSTEEDPDNTREDPQEGAEDEGSEGDASLSSMEESDARSHGLANVFVKPKIVIPRAPPGIEKSG